MAHLKREADESSRDLWTIVLAICLQLHSRIGDPHWGSTFGNAINKWNIHFQYEWVYHLPMHSIINIFVFDAFIPIKGQQLPRMNWPDESHGRLKFEWETDVRLWT